MFYIFILSFITLSDPMLTLSSNVGKSAQFQDSPIVSSSHSNNVRSHLLHKTEPSSTRLLQPVNHSLDKSVVLPPQTKLFPSSEHEENYFIPNVVNGNNGKSDVIGDGSEHDNKVITSLDPEVPISVEQWTTYEDASFPFLLKLDREYTPAERADYIFTTGDEKGFVQGVAEMIEDGQIMASRDDVISFLEAVQEKLSELRRDQDNHEMKEEKPSV